MSSNTNPIRKSNRTRHSTEKVSSTNTKSIVNNNTSQTKQKKRKLSIEEEEKQTSIDKIDPVEKLLSLTNINNDFLSDLESESEYDSNDNKRRKKYHNQQDINHHQQLIHNVHEDCEDEEDDEPKQIASVNFTKILQDNIRQYYLKKLQNQYNDSFAMLNKNTDDIKQQSQPQQVTKPTTSPFPAKMANTDVPFFKNVNFGHSKEYTIDDYFAYDDDDEEEEEKVDNSSNCSSQISSPISSPTTTTTTLYYPKINNLYRQQSFNFAYQSRDNSSIGNSSIGGNSIVNSNYNNCNDVSRIMNINSIITGKDSEMVSTGNFMINDFYL